MKKIKTIEVALCDICGKEADGHWYMTVNSLDTLYSGGVSGEYSCPLDLCKEHMRHYDNIVQSTIKYTTERYDGTPKEDDLSKLKEIILEVSEGSHYRGTWNRYKKNMEEVLLDEDFIS